MTSGYLPSLSLADLGAIKDLLSILQIDILNTKNQDTFENLDSQQHEDEVVSVKPFKQFSGDRNGNMMPAKLGRQCKRKSHPVHLANLKRDQTWTWSSTKEMHKKVGSLRSTSNRLVMPSSETTPAINDKSKYPCPESEDPSLSSTVLQPVANTTDTGSKKPDPIHTDLGPD